MFDNEIYFDIKESIKRNLRGYILATMWYLQNNNNKTEAAKKDMNKTGETFHISEMVSW